jgi:uncharacterized protein
MTTIKRSSIFIIISSFLFIGCSSFFYYPTQIEYVNKDTLPAKPEEFSIPASDGHQIPVWYFKSAQKQTKGIIVHFHGNAQNLTSHFAFLHTAPLNGYDHLIFDYRGYGKSAGKPNPENTVADGMSVLRWIKNKYPKTPMIVLGQSLGSVISLKTIINLQKEFVPDVVVIDSGFSSYRSVARTVLSNHWITWLLQPIGWLVVDNSMAPTIEELPAVPLLVVHGTQDPVVAFQHGKKIFDKAKEPKTFWTIEGGKHTQFLFIEKYKTDFYKFLEDSIQK